METTYLGDLQNLFFLCVYVYTCVCVHVHMGSRKDSTTPAAPPTPGMSLSLPPQHWGCIPSCLAFDMDAEDSDSAPLLYSELLADRMLFLAPGLPFLSE